MSGPKRVRRAPAEHEGEGDEEAEHILCEIVSHLDPQIKSFVCNRNKPKPKKTNILYNSFAITRFAKKCLKRTTSDLHLSGLPNKAIFPSLCATPNQAAGFDNV